jgi:hypothetical protein
MNPSKQGAIEQHALVLFDGARLLDPDGLLLAEMGEDGRWYTSDSLPCSGLSLPAPRLEPTVAQADRDAAKRAADSAWMDGAHQALAQLAATQEFITSDDLWAALSMPPRESRMIGNALARAQNSGLIERTAEHRPSTRPENHARPVRVWRSLRFAQQHIC